MTVRTEPQQRRSRDKRDRLLAATADLLAEVPFDEIGTKLISDRAGVSIGSLYRFFPSREAIFEALLATWFDKLVEVMDALVAEPPATAAGFVGSVVDGYASFWRDEPGYRHVSSLQAAPGAGRLNDEQLADRLERTLTGHYGLPDSPELRSRILLLISIAEFVLNKAFRADPEGDPLMLDELRLLMLRYLAVE